MIRCIKYGTADKYASINGQDFERFFNKDISVVIRSISGIRPNSLLGDPAPGMKKQLVVEMDSGDKIIFDECCNMLRFKEIKEVKRDVKELNKFLKAKKLILIFNYNNRVTQRFINRNLYLLNDEVKMIVVSNHKNFITNEFVFIHLQLQLDYSLFVKRHCIDSEYIFLFNDKRIWRDFLPTNWTDIFSKEKVFRFNNYFDMWSIKNKDVNLLTLRQYGDNVLSKYKINPQKPIDVHQLLIVPWYREFKERKFDYQI